MIKTAMTLSADQLERMVRYVRCRIEAIDASRSTGWIADRERFEREWNDDFQHRALENAVFAKSNESLNMVGAGVDYIRSRTLEEIFCTKPWFSTEAQDAHGSSPVLSEQVARHLRWKLGPEQINFDGLAAELVTQACKLGECVAKVFYKTDREEFERIATILYDGKRNTPVVTATGEFVFPETYAAWLATLPEAEAAAVRFRQSANPAHASAVQPFTGNGDTEPSSEIHLLAQEASPVAPDIQMAATIYTDGVDYPVVEPDTAAAPGLTIGQEDSTFIPPAALASTEPVPPELGGDYEWREQIISDTAVHYSGAKAVPLHYKEFYCPLNAPSLEEADFVAHMTSMRLSELCGHLGISLEPEDPAEANSAAGVSYIKETLRQLRHQLHRPKSESSQPRPGEGVEHATPNADPEFRLLEAYFKFDARNDGKPCRVFLMIAYDYDLPLFWDYIANITPGGRYPFEAVVINREPHRWYGKSWFKKYERCQHLVDKLLNQIIYRNELAANPIKFRKKQAVVQWQDDQPFEVGPDRVFDLNEGYSAEEALQTAQIPELDGQTKFLLETVIATWRARSGVTVAAQGDFGDLPNHQTATGVAQLVASGTTMFRPQVFEVRRGLEAVLRQLVAYQYAYQETDESYPYGDGEERMLGLLSRESVRNMKLEITLAPPRQQTGLDAAKLAVDFFERFLAVPDAYKSVAAPLFANVYKSLQVDDADDYFLQAVKVAGTGEPGAERFASANTAALLESPAARSSERSASTSANRPQREAA